MLTSKFVTVALTVIVLSLISTRSIWGLDQNEIIEYQKEINEMNKSLPRMTSSEMQLTTVYFRGNNEIVFVTKTTLYRRDF